MKRKYGKLVWIGIVVLVMMTHHVIYTVVQNVYPFSDTFGRAKQIGTANFNTPVSVLDDGTLAYLQQNQIEYVKLHPDLSTAEVKHLPLPDHSLDHASDVKIFKQGMVWIANKQLYLALLQGDRWGPVYPLGISMTFDVVEHGNQFFLVTSDHLQLRLATWTGDRMSEWQTLRIQDITHVKAFFHPNGHLFVTSLADYGPNGKSIWWTEWDPEGEKLVVQSKIHSFQIENGRTVEEFELGIDQTNAYVFHTERTHGKRDSRLFVTTFPIDQSKQPESREVKLPVHAQSKGDNGDARDPYAVRGSDGSLELALSSRGQIMLIRFQQGKQVGEIRVSSGRTTGFAPVVPAAGGNVQNVIWLEHSAKSESNILATSNNPVYRKESNRLQILDYLEAIRQVFSGQTGVVFALAASFKWIALPYLYLAGFRLWNKKSRTSMSRMHVGVALGVYLTVKLLLIDQFYADDLLPNMPAWMAWGGSRYILALATAAIAFAVTGFKDMGETRNSSSQGFTVFVLFDIGLTAVWYGFFIR